MNDGRNGAVSYLARGAANRYRWFRLAVAVLVMIMISPYEYAFTVFESPIAKANHWSLPSVATTYTIYIVVSALFMIPSGRWSDRWQPRWFTTAAGVVTGLGWIAAAFAAAPWQLYVAYGIGALGPGYIYCNNVNNALKWFPEPRLRGRAVGIVNTGFGLGAAIAVPILSPIIKSGTYGYQTAFLAAGVTMLVLIVTLAQFLHYPEPGWLPAGWNPATITAPATHRSGPRDALRDVGPKELLKTWQYWWVLVSLCFIAAAGLMITAHVASIAKANVLVTGAAIGVTTATLAPIPNGIMRWVGGQISDYAGRERTMLVSFCIMGVTTFFLAHVGTGWLFVVLALIAVGTWSPLFSLYPALVGDYWGRSNSAVNYGLVYGPGKAIAGVFGGLLAATLYTAFGTWTVPLYVAGALAIVSGLMTLGLRRPGLAAVSVTETAGTATAPRGNGHRRSRASVPRTSQRA
jgi:MFS transporter, OFA family, oxalate/formate antiporter